MFRPPDRPALRHDDFAHGDIFSLFQMFRYFRHFSQAEALEQRRRARSRTFSPGLLFMLPPCNAARAARTDSILFLRATERCAAVLPPAGARSPLWRSAAAGCSSLLLICFTRRRHARDIHYCRQRAARFYARVAGAEFTLCQRQLLPAN